MAFHRRRSTPVAARYSCEELFGEQFIPIERRMSSCSPLETAGPRFPVVYRGGGAGIRVNREAPGAEKSVPKRSGIAETVSMHCKKQTRHGQLVASHRV